MESSLFSEVRIAQRETRVLTWNINGLRKVAAGHGGLEGLLDQFGTDISKFSSFPTVTMYCTVLLSIRQTLCC